MLIIHLTNKCNQNCLFCNRPPDMLDIETDEVKKKIITAINKKESTLFFNGGEPSIRRDIIELISFAKSKGIKRVEIVTNGLMFSNNEFMKKIKAAGLDKISLSMHSHIFEIENKLAQRKDRYMLLEKALKNLKQQNMPILINNVLNNYNYKHLKEFVEQTKKRYPNIISYNFLLANPVGNALKNKEVLVKISNLKPYLQKMMHFAEKKNISFTIEFLPFCIMKGYEKHMQICSLDPEVIANLDDHAYSGDYFKVGKDNPDSDEIKKLFVKPPTCKKCIKYNICPGLSKAYAEIFGVDEIENY